MAETLNVSSMLPRKFEPKMTNRWVFALEGVDSYLIKTAARPNVSMASVPIPFINSKRYVSSGIIEFGTMAITLHDPIAPSGAHGMGQNSCGNRFRKIRLC